MHRIYSQMGSKYPLMMLPCPISFPGQEKRLKREHQVIYEAAFSFDNIFVKVDILRKHEGKWEIYEVKNSTSVKDVHHYNDVAVQYYVLKGTGLPVSKAFLVHINSQYVRNRRYRG